MAQTSWQWTAEHCLPSQTHVTNEVLAGLLEFLEREGWPARDIFGIHMAVEEALVNAIQHGNGEDPAKQVRVRFQATATRLRVEITDEGAGFKPAAVADPTCGERLCEPHGRGLLLMRAYMSKVEYLGCGNHLVMEKRRSRKSRAA